MNEIKGRELKEGMVVYDRVCDTEDRPLNTDEEHFSRVYVARECSIGDLFLVEDDVCLIEGKDGYKKYVAQAFKVEPDQTYYRTGVDAWIAGCEWDIEYYEKKKAGSQAMLDLYKQVKADREKSSE